MPTPAPRPGTLASAMPDAQGLYDPAQEHDACGVAFVVDVAGRASHDIADQGLTALRNLEHRGASGSEPDSGDGAGDDQADAGSATLEREQELSLANNAKHLLEQTRHALERIDAGIYGDCESCGTPIGKMRLQAFPRATLCMTCKQKQERR